MEPFCAVKPKLLCVQEVLTDFLESLYKMGQGFLDIQYKYSFAYDMPFKLEFINFKSLAIQQNQT